MLLRIVLVIFPMFAIAGPGCNVAPTVLIGVKPRCHE